MALRVYTKTVTTTGGAGSSSGAESITLSKPGYLVGIAVNYTSEPATTDVTVTNRVGGDSGIDQTVLTLTNRNTDLAFSRLFTDPIDEGGAVQAGANVNSVPIVAGVVTVTVAQGDNNGTVKVVLAVDDGL